MNASGLQVGLVPADLQRSLTFYRDVLQLPQGDTIPLGDGMALHIFNVGDAIVKVIEQPTVPATAPSAPRFEMTGMRWFTFYLDPGDIDTAMDRCAKAGATIEMPLTEIRAGLRVSIVADPDGNSVELVEQT